MYCNNGRLLEFVPLIYANAYTFMWLGGIICNWLSGYWVYIFQLNLSLWLFTFFEHDVLFASSSILVTFHLHIIIYEDVQY